MSEWRLPQAAVVPVLELEDHPLNANQMTPGQERQLQAHIKANGGLYPRLIVREIASDSEFFQEGGAKYQILDGHQRKPNLVKLGMKEVAVDIWPEIDDAAAVRLLATLNRLHGSAIPVKQAELLKAFETLFSPDDAEIYLTETPEERQGLRKILEISEREIEPDTREAIEAAENVDVDEPETIMFSGVYPGQKAVIDRALDGICEQLKGKNKRTRALEFLAAEFLAGDQQVPEHVIEDA